MTVDLAPNQPRFVLVSRLLNWCRRTFGLLRRFWWLLILPPLLGAGAAYAWHRATPQRYDSTAKLWITSELNLTDSRPASEDLMNYIGTQAELLRSETVRERALALMSSRYRALSTNESSQLNLVVRDSVRNSIIELHGTGPDPLAARFFLQAVVDSFFQFKLQSKETSSERTLVSVTQQVAHVSAVLKASQEALQFFQASNNVSLLQEQGSSVGAYLVRVNRQLSALKTEFSLLELLSPDQLLGVAQQSASLSPSEPLPGQATSHELSGVLAGPQADAYRAEQQLGLLQSKQAEWSEYMRPAHPKMLKLNEEIAIQQRLLAVYRDQSRAQLALRKESLRLQIQNMEATLVEWEAKVLAANRKLAQAERLQQAVQQNQRLYDRLVGVIQTVDVNQHAGVERVSVLESASAALPLRFSLALLLGLSVGAGFLFGFLCLYIIALFDDRYVSVSELYQHLECAVAAEVPQVSFRGRKGVPLLPSEQDRPVFEEAFRTLRSSLLFGMNGSGPAKTILVTSAVPEEGKSTVAANLAMALAAGGKSVLLVDADLRQSKLHRLLGAPSGPGLAEILSQGVSYDACFQDTEFPGLRFLPAGDTQVNPGDLFLTPAASLFLQGAAQSFDYVLLDTPPVLVADDTSTLCSMVDGVFFVVRASFTPAARVRRALDLLTTRKARILGAVYNRTRPSFADGSPYSYSRYHRRYPSVPVLGPVANS